jgi:hypothetical protein
MADLWSNSQQRVHGRTKCVCRFIERFSAVIFLDLPFKTSEESQRQQEKELSLIKFEDYKAIF